MQISKSHNVKGNILCGSKPELRRTSSFDRTWEETVAESIANELVSQVQSSTISSTKSGSLNSPTEIQDAAVEDASKSRLKDSKQSRSNRVPHEEKKAGKAQEEKRARPQKMMEFHNIKISQVCLYSAHLFFRCFTCLYIACKIIYLHVQSWNFEKEVFYKFTLP